MSDLLNNKLQLVTLASYSTENWKAHGSSTKRLLRALVNASDMHGMQALSLAVMHAHSKISHQTPFPSFSPQRFQIIALRTPDLRAL